MCSHHADQSFDRTGSKFELDFEDQLIERLGV